MKINFLFSLLFATVLITACGEDSCDTTDVTYTNTIAAIFDASCATAGCHVAGNEANAYFSLEGYTNAKNSAEVGRMVGSIQHLENFSPMPKGGDMLPECDIDKIAAWIAAGAPE